MRRPKLLVITPYASDANSFWRCIGPLTYFAKDENVQLTILDQRYPVNWVDLIQHDAIFMHRPCRPDDLIIMQIAYNLSIPVWIDFDDWLFGIPAWNPNAPAYLNHATQNIMAQCIACADIVSVSTAELYNLYSSINPNVVVVNNAYRSDLFTYRGGVTPERSTQIVWRGSNTHEGDLLSVREGFKHLKHPVTFLGSASWLLLNGMKEDSYKVTQAADVIMYFKHIYDLAPKAMIFPLFDCLFNRCKSNIAYIEAIHAGALCIAPDLPEWRREGVITYEPHNNDSFLEAVHYVTDLPDNEHADLASNAFRSMKGLYDISNINHIRSQIMANLISGMIEKKNPFDQTLGLKALSMFRALAQENIKNDFESRTKEETS